MTADAECRHRESHFHGFVCGAGLRHERGAGKDFGSMKLEDGAIDARGESEVVGIHDETGHEDKLINVGAGAERAAPAASIADMMKAGPSIGPLPQGAVSSVG